MSDWESGPRDRIAGDAESLPGIGEKARQAIEWEVGPAGDFDEQGDHRRIIRIVGRDVIVFRRGDRYYALDNTCPHMGEPLGEAFLAGKVAGSPAEDIHIVCPWHGYRYSIETGEVAGGHEVGLRTYPTVERDGLVYVLGEIP